MFSIHVHTNFIIGTRQNAQVKVLVCCFEMEGKQRSEKRPFSIKYLIICSTNAILMMGDVFGSVFCVFVVCQNKKPEMGDWEWPKWEISGSCWLEKETVHSCGDFGGFLLTILIIHWFIAIVLGTGDGTRGWIALEPAASRPQIIQLILVTNCDSQSIAATGKLQKIICVAMCNAQCTRNKKRKIRKYFELRKWEKEKAANQMHTMRIFSRFLNFHRRCHYLNAAEQICLCLFVRSFSLEHIELVCPKSNVIPIRMQYAALAHYNSNEKKYVFTQFVVLLSAIVMAKMAKSFSVFWMYTLIKLKNECERYTKC